MPDISRCCENFNTVPSKHTLPLFKRREAAGQRCLLKDVTFQGDTGTSALFFSPHHKAEDEKRNGFIFLMKYNYPSYAEGRNRPFNLWGARGGPMNGNGARRTGMEEGSVRVAVSL